MLLNVGRWRKDAMPFGLGWPELTIILVIVLVLFGAHRVPEIGRALGRGIREFRGSVSETKDDLEGAAKPKDAEQKGEAAAEKS